MDTLFMVLASAVLLINLVTLYIQMTVADRMTILKQGLKGTNEVHTMALSKSISILDSHTASIEDINSDIAEIKAGVTAILKNAEVQTKALSKIIDAYK